MATVAAILEKLDNAPDPFSPLQRWMHNELMQRLSVHERVVLRTERSFWIEDASTRALASFICALLETDAACMVEILVTGGRARANFMGAVSQFLSTSNLMQRSATTLRSFHCHVEVRTVKELIFYGSVADLLIVTNATVTLLSAMMSKLSEQQQNIVAIQHGEWRGSDAARVDGNLDTSDAYDPNFDGSLSVSTGDMLKAGFTTRVWPAAP